MKTLSVTDWNKSPIYRQELDAFLSTPTGEALISVLRSVTPRVPRQHGLDAQFLLIEQGRTLNHLDVLDRIESLRRELPDQEPVKPTYDATNND